MFNLYKETIEAERTPNANHEVKYKDVLPIVENVPSKKEGKKSSGKKEEDKKLKLADGGYASTSNGGLRQPDSGSKEERRYLGTKEEENKLKLADGGKVGSSNGGLRQSDSGLENLPSPSSPRTYRAQRAEELRQQQPDDGTSIESFENSASVVPGALYIPGFGGTTSDDSTRRINPTSAATSNHINTTTPQSEEEGAISATLVEEDEQEKEAELTEKILNKIAVSAEEAEVVSPKQKRIYLWAGFCLLVVAVALGVTLGVTLSSPPSSGSVPANPENKHRSTAPPSTLPIPISSEEILMDLVLPISGLKAVEDEESAAYKAFKWMIYNDTFGIDFENTDSDLLVERYVMVVIYFSTGGPNWFDQVGFLNDTSICVWPYPEEGEEEGAALLGVRCNNVGRVNRLRLFHNNLIGTIPSEISGLEQLEYLSLESNSLSGTLPSTIGSLLQLEDLFLTLNELTGTLPLQLAELSNLYSLFLWGNLLSGTIPEALTQHARLLFLLLGQNMFEGTIPEFVNRMGLQVLSLHENILTGSIPSSLFNLNNVNALRFENNELTGGIDSGLGKMASLRRMNAANNILGGTIPDLSGLVNLEELELGNNQLTGSIPSNWSLGQKLSWLRLNNNILSGNIPSELGLLTDLWHLDIQSNSISGQVPLELSGLTGLGTIRLQDNDITGSLAGLCLRSLPYFLLEADCAEVTCSCCTTCCDASSCTSDPVGVCLSLLDEWSGCDCQQESNDKSVQMVCDGGTCTSCDASGDTCARSYDYGPTFDEFGLNVGWKAMVQYVQGRNELIEYTALYNDVFGCRFGIDGNECRSCITGWACPDGTYAHYIDCRNVNDYGIYDACSEDYGHEVFEVVYMRETLTFYPEDCIPFGA